MQIPASHWPHHQNHESDHAHGNAAVRFKQERDRNWKLVGDRRKFFNTRDADYILTDTGLQNQSISPKRIIRAIEKFPVLNKQFGFIVEPIVLIVRGIRFFRDKLRARS